MKVLVTGGAGFIGSHITDKLIEKGINVVVLDNLITGSIVNIHPNAAFIRADIRSKDILEIFLKEKFDYVIHEAAQTMVPNSLANPQYDCDVNVMGLVNILEACRHSGVRRIVFASSAAVYGNTDIFPTVERNEKQPTSFYGLSKLTEEHYLDMYFKHFGLEYVVLRYANVYGERQADSSEGGVISVFLKRVLERQPIRVYGDGTQTRDFVYVKDVADANFRAIFTTAINKSYNISTGKETTVNKLITTLQNISGKMIKIEYYDKRVGDIYRSVLSNEAARKELNWQPGYSLYKGLERTYNWMLNHGMASYRNAFVNINNILPKEL